MPLTFFVQVSTAGYADGDFVPYASLPDLGTPVSFDHVPVVPGQVYIYRARRQDSVTSLFSPWAYAFARAPYPLQESVMIDTQEVITSADERLFVGIEAFEGVPSKVQFQAELVSGGFTDTRERRFSRVKRKTKTLRRAGVKGKIGYKGSFVLEFRAEGATLALLASSLAYESTTVLASPVRYRQRYSNKKGLKTLTVVHQIGDTYNVYTGCKCDSLKLAPDFSGTDTLLITLDMMASGSMIFEKRITPGVEALLGIDTASADLSTPYAPDDGSVYLNGLQGAGAENFDATLTNTFASYKERDGTRSPKGFVEITGNPTATVTTYFNRVGFQQRYRDLGYAADPTTVYGPQRGGLITAPVSLVFDPPANSGGFVNTFGWVMPNCDVTTQITTQGDQEVQMTLSVSPLDAPLDASGTDLYVEITNSVTAAQIVAPSAPLDPSAYPRFADRNYIYGFATGTPTTTNIVAGAANLQLSTVDGAYIGRRLRFISGALKGNEQIVTAYTGATCAFTVGAAFGSAPAVGDAFVIL